MNSLSNRESNLLKELEELRSDIRKVRANKSFLCACGKMHKIKRCTVIQTHWYTPPSGCTEGDYWNEGELQIICPVTDVRNRVLFETRTEIDWINRSKYNCNPEQQFSSMYKRLFKEVIKEYDTDMLYNYYNNYYFDKNHKKFEIKIENV